MAGDRGSEIPDPPIHVQAPLRMQTPDGVENRAARIQVHRVAKLVGPGRRDRFDPCGQVSRVMTAGAASAHRTEEIPQGAIPEKIERLVGYLERDWPCVLADPAARASPVLALVLEVWRGGDEALLHHAVDDLLDQLFELLPRGLLIAVGRLAQELLQRILRQHAALNNASSMASCSACMVRSSSSSDGSPHGSLKPLDSSMSESFETRSSRSISSSSFPVYFV